MLSSPPQQIVKTLLYASPTRQVVYKSRYPTLRHLHAIPQDFLPSVHLTMHRSTYIPCTHPYTVQRTYKIYSTAQELTTPAKACTKLDPCLPVAVGGYDALTLSLISSSFSLIGRRQSLPGIASLAGCDWPDNCKACQR